MNRPRLIGIVIVSAALLAGGLYILLSSNREGSRTTLSPATEAFRKTSPGGNIQPESAPPPAVRQAAEAFRREKKRRQLIAKTALATRADSLEALAEEARSNYKDPEEIARYIGKGMAALGRADFRQLQPFFSDEPFPDHQQILDHFLETWDYETFEAPEDEPARLLDRFVEMAGNSPESAARIAEALPESDLRDIAAFETAETWALADLDGALSWLDSLEAGSPLRPWVAEGIAEAWTKSDPPGAAAWAVTISDPDSRSTALATALSTWALKEPQSALNWFSENVPVSSELWKAMAPEISGSLGSIDLRTARSWIETLPPGKARDSATLSGALEAVAVQPEATMNWLIGLGDDEAVFHTAAAWAAEAPVDLSGYLRDLPGSPIRDRAILGMVAIHASEDPEFSLHWALDIRSRQIRDEGMQVVLGSWLQRHGLRGAQTMITRFAGTLESEGQSDDAEFLRVSAQRITLQRRARQIIAGNRDLRLSPESAFAPTDIGVN